MREIRTYGLRRGCWPDRSRTAGRGLLDPMGRRDRGVTSASLANVVVGAHQSGYTTPLPGFMIPLGSSAVLIARISASSTGVL
jgi:hypothetical protein